MGSWWEFEKKCPKCGARIPCYYRPTEGATQVRCFKCGEEYDIVMSFRLSKLRSPKPKK